MSTPRKKIPSRKDRQQKTRYLFILGDTLHLKKSDNQAAQEHDTSDIENKKFPASGRRSTDIHVIGLLDSWEKLSSREKEVVFLVCKRMRNNEIAAEMGVTVGTINSYLNHIYNKLDLRSKMDLFHMFYNFDFRNNPPY